jgi:hypothetical protein
VTEKWQKDEIDSLSREYPEVRFALVETPEIVSVPKIEGSPTLALYRSFQHTCPVVVAFEWPKDLVKFLESNMYPLVLEVSSIR